MHPAQKQAVLVMLQSIQSQIMQVQSLLGFDVASSNPAAPRETPRSPAQTEYLSDEEEAKLEAHLEEQRQDGLKEAEMIAKAWARQQAEFHGTGVAF